MGGEGQREGRRGGSEGEEERGGIKRTAAQSLKTRVVSAA